MKKCIYASFLIVLLTFSGCGYKEGVVTPEKKSYLYFTGNVTGVTVTVDNGTGFSIEAGKVHQYQVETGKHKVQVFRNNNLIVDRDIYVGDGISKEIEVQP